jgi:hypothetical protein
MLMYHLDVAVDVDETVTPPWVTIRVVEGGAHRGGMTQRKEDFVPPFQVAAISDLVTFVEEKLLEHLAALDGVQLTL